MEIIEELEIIDNTSEGLGVAKAKNVTVFVKNTLINDIVDVYVVEKKKNFWIAKVKNFKKHSEFRNNSFDEKLSEVYPFINLNYDKEIQIKKNIIINNFRKNAKITLNDIDILKSERFFNYRNKIELKIDDDFELCYCIESGENKVKIENCPVTNENINEFLPFLKNKLKEHKIKAYDFNTDCGNLKNISIRCNSSSEIILTLVVKAYNRKIEDLVKNLSNYKNLIAGYVSINNKKNSVLISNDIKEIFIKKEFKDNIGKYVFKISPKSFFQVNSYQTENLYNVASDFLGKNKNLTLLDLYCGIGTTTIYFSENFKKVIGVEVVKDSIKDAKQNAKLNSIENVEFVYGKSEEKIEQILKQNNIDIVSVDPPRKGLDKKIIESISKSKIKKIVYISCNSATLARDIKLFQDIGFTIEKIKAVDMFSKTPHVECIALIQRVKS